MFRLLTIFPTTLPASFTFDQPPAVFLRSNHRISLLSRTVKLTVLHTEPAKAITKWLELRDAISQMARSICKALVSLDPESRADDQRSVECDDLMVGIYGLSTSIDQNPLTVSLVSVCMNSWRCHGARCQPLLMAIALYTEDWVSFLDAIVTCCHGDLWYQTNSCYGG